MKKTRKFRSRSFLKPFLYNYANYIGGQTNACSDVGGVSRSTSASIPSCIHPGLNSFGASDSQGIQVGTNNTAVTLTDYKLNTKILHGTTSGKLEHLGTYVRNLTVGASTASFDLECMFKNAHATDSVVIAESGIYGVNSYYFCLVRDVLASTVTVAAGEYLLVTYTIQVSV